MEKVYELLLLFSSYLILALINVFMPYFTRRTESLVFLSLRKFLKRKS